MKRKRMKLLSAITFAALVFALSPFMSTADRVPRSTVSGKVADAAVYAAVDTEKLTEAEVYAVPEKEIAAEKTVITAEKLAAMLDMNYCYNKSFGDPDALRGCAAMSLAEYAVDMDGYGLCISSAFVEIFARDFYGVQLSPFASGDLAPEGYIAVPEGEPGTFCHLPVTMTEDGDEIELVTRMEYYGGGSDRDSHLVKSRFVLDADSVFGVNLVFSEIL